MAGKESLRRVLPAQVVTVASTALDHTLPSRRRNLWWQRQQRIIASLIEEHGPVVQAGPFRGLRLPTTGAWGNLAPLLVGSYESELHAVIEELIVAAPPRVINVGCAEGYYAVGFAQRLPQADVYAFDIDERGQRVTGETARMNGCADRLHIAGICTTDSLGRVLIPRTLVVVDCEGCELELLRPDRVPLLRDATVLVELHDFLDPEISPRVVARFTGTHSLRLVLAEARARTDYPALEKLKSADRAIAVNEARPTEPHPMQWGVLEPLPRPS